MKAQKATIAVVLSAVVLAFIEDMSMSIVAIFPFIQDRLAHSLFFGIVFMIFALLIVVTTSSKLKAKLNDPKLLSIPVVSLIIGAFFDYTVLGYLREISPTMSFSLLDLGITYVVIFSTFFYIAWSIITTILGLVVYVYWRCQK